MTIMKLNKLILFFGLLITTLFSYAQVENVILEKYYVSDDFDALDTAGGYLPSGSITYRIYVDLAPGSKLLKIYGDNNHPFTLKSTAPFFNNSSDGQSFGKDFSKSRFANNTVALDSWLTIGQIGKANGNQTYYGIPKEQDTDGSFIGGSNNDGGSDALPFGLLNNTDPATGTPITLKDGIISSQNSVSTWGDYGVKNFLNSDDSTVFGSIVKGSEFTSKNFFLGNSGTIGVDSLKNQILIAQVTTSGELTFAFNFEVLELVNGIPTKVQYVSNDSILKSGNGFNEKYSGFLKYPFTCGCVDRNYLEFNPKAVCEDKGACKTKVVLGCMDPMACNYDATANMMVHNLCCYPGSCNNRDIAEVCPSLLENTTTFEIHPNPAHNFLYMDAKTGTEQTISYEIFDVFGNKILSKNFGKTTVLVNEAVDINELPNGIYHIRLTIGNSIESKTFIKN